MTGKGVAAMLATLLASAADAQPPRFSVAIVRTDGRLVPFAAWNGAAWERAWPEIFAVPITQTALDEAWSRRGKDVPRLWRVLPSSGGGPVPARARGVEIVEAHCETQVALKADFPDPMRRDPELETVEGRFGIAVDGAAAPVRALQRLRRSHALWSKAQQAVRAGFDAREKAAAQARNHALPRDEPTPRVQLRELYREAGSPGSPLYFVAERTYATGPFVAEVPCPWRTVMSGWLAPAGGGGLALLDPRVFVTSCGHGKDAGKFAPLYPLGALRVGRRSFWVVQEHGWEDETYVILEVGPAEVRRAFAVAGGGC
jgi:hypothetical protein